MDFGHHLESAKPKQRHCRAIGQLATLPAQERSHDCLTGIARLVGELFNRQCRQVAHQRTHAQILVNLLNRRHGVIDITHAGQTI